MPARSNDFQRLVAIVQRALAPKGARIVESKSIESLGSMREIDVLIEAPIGPYNIRIAVEAKAHKRPLDVNVVEEYVGRYSVQTDFKVNQIVIVSSSGFTKSARQRAKASNVALLTLTEATESYFAKLGPRKASESFISRSPLILERVTFEPAIDLPLPMDLLNCPLRCRCCGKSHGTVAMKARKQIEKILKTTDLERHLLKLGEKATHAHLDTRICAHKLELLPTNSAPISTGVMVCRFGVTWKRSEMKTQIFKQESADGQTALIRRMLTSVDGQRIEMVMSDGPCPDRIVLNITDDEECPQPSGPRLWPKIKFKAPIVLERNRTPAALLQSAVGAVRR